MSVSKKVLKQPEDCSVYIRFVNNQKIDLPILLTNNWQVQRVGENKYSKFNTKTEQLDSIMVVSCKMGQMVCRIELFEKICIIKARHYTMFPSHRLTRNYFQSRAAVHSSLKNSHTTRIECARLYYTHYDQSFLILSKKLMVFCFQNCTDLL